MQTSAQWVWAFGPFELDPATRELRRGGQVIPLEPKAFDVLLLLLERAPDVVEKAEIFTRVWKDVAVTDNALTRVVAQLRRALNDPAKQPEIVATVATRGYRFVMPAEHRSRAEREPLAIAPSTPSEPPARTTPPAHGSLRPTWLWALVAAAGITAFVAVADRRQAVPVNVNVRPEAAPGFNSLAALTPRQVTTGSSFDGHPTFSPDSTAFAFSSDRSGALEIYVQGLSSGSTPRALTSDRQQNVEPAWSPDGRYIAYHQASSGGIWIVPALGGAPRQLAVRGSRPSWSPDSRSVAYQTMVTTTVFGIDGPPGPSSIAVVDVATLTVRAITEPGSPPGPHLVPRWSRDGRHVLFVETGTSYLRDDSKIWSVDVADGSMRVEASGPQVAPEFLPLPHGRRSLVVAKGAGSLWWQPLGSPAGQRAVPTGLVVKGALVSHLARAVDGRLLAWTSADATTHVWSIAKTRTGAWAEARQLTAGQGLNAYLPTATPSGVLYSSVIGGGMRQIAVLARDGTSRQVTFDDGQHLAPVWMASLGEAVFYARHGDRLTLNAVNPQTSRERELFSLDQIPLPKGGRMFPVTYSNVVPSPSFDRLVVTVLVNDTPNLWIVNLGDRGTPVGTPTQITNEPEGAAFPEWSPDGRWLAYQCTSGPDVHACAVRGDGSDRHQLTNTPGQSWTGGWMTDDRVLIAARRSGVWNVHAVSLDGRTEPVTSFTDATSFVRRPRWDAENNRVVFERSQLETARVWLVELGSTERAMRLAVDSR